MTLTEQTITQIGLFPTALYAWWEDTAVTNTLAVRIVIRALYDAAGIDLPSVNPTRKAKIKQDARAWLISEDAEYYLSVLKIELCEVRDWVKAGCPKPDFKNVKESPHDELDEKDITKVYKLLKRREKKAYGADHQWDFIDCV